MLIAMLKMNNVKQKGFTLLEVLIASVIMFSAIVLTATIYSNSVQSSLKAQRAVNITSVLPVLIETIESHVQKENQMVLTGSGELLDVEYSWKAKRNTSSPILPDGLSEIGESGRNAYLWDVTLNVQFGHIQRIYTYKEFSYD